MYPPGLSPKRPWTELDHPWLSKHISLVDRPKLNAQRGRGKANRWGGWVPNATKAALAAATEFQSPVRWRHFWTSEQPSLLSPPLLLFPLMIPHHIFHVKRLYVSFTFYQTHETCTCCKCNRFSQMTRQPLNGNKKVISPPDGVRLCKEEPPQGQGREFWKSQLRWVTCTPASHREESAVKPKLTETFYTMTGLDPSQRPLARNTKTDRKDTAD